MSKTVQYILIAVIIVIIILLVAFRNKIQAMASGKITTVSDSDSKGAAPSGGSSSQEPKPLDKNKILQMSSKGEEVRRLQQIIGANADGIFGPKTKQSLINYTQSVYGTAYDMITLNDLELIAAGQNPTHASDAGIVSSYSQLNTPAGGNVFGGFFNGWLA